MTRTQFSCPASDSANGTLRAVLSFKNINNLKIRPMSVHTRAAMLLAFPFAAAGRLRHVIVCCPRRLYAVILFILRSRTTRDIISHRLTTKTNTYRLPISALSCQYPLLNSLDMATWVHRKSCYRDSCHEDNAGLIQGSPWCSSSFFGDTGNDYYT